MRFPISHTFLASSGMDIVTTHEMSDFNVLRTMGPQPLRPRTHRPSVSTEI